MNQDLLVEAVLASGVVLPAPGPGFLRLQAAAADENAGPRELAAAVSQDPAITGALLRVANSPVFRPRSAPRSAQEAITMLGRTRTLATAASTALRNQGSGLDDKAIEALWAASARAADLTYAVCRATPFKGLADTAYLAALMQDAGIAVLLRRAPEHAVLFHCTDCALEAGARALDVLTGSDHTAAGFLVARNWKLPVEVCEAIRAHHEPAMALRLGDSARRIALLLATGRRLRDGLSPDWTDWAEPVEAELGLTEAALDQISADEH
ncbi:MAG: HDOD domain-containing protein [Zoogloea oleivorans]|jgi:HD-like signal output (HDOD) protein|uniref:HDOD domain-containing protein n=1 Tax=Zoogloea oleivorans TaxID=1552750 RepID=UPI002A35D82B|nr:HDOD domain-containing protein [Zoogloea oleivorans]MDY0034661.1 HDOD domain-containing protein [Zoogloea oleivorans]